MVYSHPNNLVTQNMSLEETKALFESKSNEATKKYHVKIYREFAKLCHILIKRPLTEDQKSTIDEELKSYRLKAVEENTYSKHKKKLTSHPKFKMLAIFYTIALVLLLSRIPWASWL